MSGAAVDLSDLLDRSAGEAFGDWDGVRIGGIRTDSRHVRRGDLFVGLPGAVTHGGRFAKDALRHGAAAVLLPKDAPMPAGAVGLRHSDPWRALAQAACRLYGDPGRGLSVVGITGTNGKTTTSLLTAHLLREYGATTSAWTTTLVDLPSTQFRPQWTTPPAHELQRFLRAAADGGSRAVVMEVSSHAVVQQRIRGVPFAVGIATNFSPDHLDFHGTVENYRAAKHAFLRSLDPGAAAILNADDPVILAMRDGVRATVYTYGTRGGADVVVRQLRQERSALKGWLELRAPDLGRPGGYPFRLPMAGRHNALNAAAAFAAALRLGVPPQAASRSIGRFRPPPRRLERTQIGPYLIYNDVAMNEASYDAVLRTLADGPPKEVVVVHALRGNRGTEINARIADIFARWDATLHFAPLVVSESRRELLRGDVDRAVRPAEVSAFRDAAARRGLACTFHVELDDAIAVAVERLRPGGVLLLLGTFGMDRGPAKARALLQERLGLHVPERSDYLTPQEADF